MGARVKHRVAGTAHSLERQAAVIKGIGSRERQTAESARLPSSKANQRETPLMKSAVHSRTSLRLIRYTSSGHVRAALPGNARATVRIQETRQLTCSRRLGQELRIALRPRYLLQLLLGVVQLVQRELQLVSQLVDLSSEAAKKSAMRPVD